MANVEKPIGILKDVGPIPHLGKENGSRGWTRALPFAHYQSSTTSAYNIRTPLAVSLADILVNLNNRSVLLLINVQPIKSEWDSS